MTVITNRRFSGRTTVCRVTLAIVFAASIPAIAGTTPDYAGIVAAPDRSDLDRQNDKRREPAKLLAFTGVRPGMKVLDVGAGAGYSTELLARAVGETGVVYAQDSAKVIGLFIKDRFDLRAQAPAMKHVIHLVRDYDDLVPQDVRDLDLVTFFFFYHAATIQGVDRAKMNRRLFDALKSGGFLVIADHSARPGDGTSVAKSLLRIDEDLVRREVEAAGFRLVAEGDFLRHAEDPRTTPVAGSKIPVDEFVLKFQKPLAAPMVPK